MPIRLLSTNISDERERLAMPVLPPNKAVDETSSPAEQDETAKLASTPGSRRALASKYHSLRKSEKLPTITNISSSVGLFWRREG